MKQEILDQLAKAILIVDNEAINLRDIIKKVPQENISLRKTLKQQQENLYKIKLKIMRRLYHQKQVYTCAVYTQESFTAKGNKFIREIYENEFNGVKIFDISKYKIPGKVCENKGDIGLIAYEKMDNTSAVIDNAIEIINKYLNYRKKDKDKRYEISETKLVDISKIRVVRPIHMYDNLNAETTKKRLEYISKKIDENKGKYPKDEAIQVHKVKDINDKRKVVYNLYDGLRRFKIAKQLNINKVYVSILEEKINQAEK